MVINGEIVVENSRSTRVDQDKIIADAIQASSNLIERAGLHDLCADWIEPDIH